jgi:sulfonate transport system permease protein
MPPAVTASQELNIPHHVVTSPHLRTSVIFKAAWWSNVLSKRSTAFILAWPLPLALLAVWWLGSSQGWIAQQTLPSPQMVLDTFSQLFQTGELQNNLVISLTRVVNGFLLGGSIGLLLGVAMGLSKTIEEYLYPTFKIIAYVPLLGWLPLLIVLFGIGEALKFVLIAKASLIPTTMNTFQGIRNVPRNFLELGKVYRFSHWQLLRRIVFPAAFPAIWNGIRYGLTHSWLILLVVELLASSEGLGYMMVSGQQLFQLDLVLVAVVVIGGIGFVMDKGLELIERRLLRWRRDAFAS